MELIAELHECGKRVLCNIVLDKLVRLLLGQHCRRGRRFLGLSMLFVLFETIQLLLSILTRQSIQTLLPASLFASLIGSLAFYVVSWCYQYTLINIETAVKRSVIGKSIENRIVEWLKKVVNIWIQIFVSIAFVGLVFLIIYLAKTRIGSSFEINLTSFISIAMAAFGMGQGGYWAVMGPLLTRELSRGKISEIGSYPLYPHRTPILVAFSKILVVCTIWDAVMVTLCVITMLVLISVSTSTSVFYIWIFVLIGYGITIWNFLYPQINLMHILQDVKQSTLLHIQLEAGKLYDELEKLGNTDLERLRHLMELHDTINKRPGTMINFSGISSFIGSLITPTAVASLGVLDWSSLLQKLILVFK